MRRTVYGIDLEIEDSLPAELTDVLPVPEASQGDDVATPLCLRRVPDGPTLAALSAGAPPTFESPTRHTSAMSALRFWSFPDRSLLWFTGIAGFWLGENEIGVSIRSPEVSRAAGVHLFGTVLPFWLEERGRSALHAAAVAVDGHAILFAGTNGAGKTTLVASLLAAGHQLLADDVAVITDGARVQPAAPWMRMWPEAAHHWTGRDPASFESVMPTVDKVRVPIGRSTFGAFCNRPSPMGRIVFPGRVAADGEARLERMAPREALIELIRHSSVPRLLEATNLRTASFERLAQVAETVPAFRLQVPDDLDRLPQVRQLVTSELTA
ncbi:MAG: hypothetical protein AAF481_13995 [Acidobacteriota bacterium]